MDDSNIPAIADRTRTTPIVPQSPSTNDHSITVRTNTEAENPAERTGARQSQQAAHNNPAEGNTEHDGTIAPLELPDKRRERPEESTSSKVSLQVCSELVVALRKLVNERKSLDLEIKSERDSLPDVNALLRKAEEASAHANELECKAKKAREQANTACHARDQGLLRKDKNQLKRGTPTDDYRAGG